MPGGPASRSTPGTSGPAFPRSGPAFPSEPAAAFGLPRRSTPFSPDDGPSFPRGASSFPASLGQGPGLPRTGASPATPPGGALPRPAGPDDGPGESTENIPAVWPRGENQLPRRIPLSERGGLPSAAARGEHAFRLFPPAEDADPATGKPED